MVSTDQLPHRPLSREEFVEFVEAQDLECPLAFAARCTHCDTEGIVNALIRDGREVYALNHGRNEWELPVLEADMDPAEFRMMAELMKANKEMLLQATMGGQSPPTEELREVDLG